MTDRQFNDAVLRLGAIPIELMRASLTEQKLDPASKPVVVMGDRDSLAA